MKIYEFIKSINKKTDISDITIMEVKKHYLSLYRAYMVWLYDEGFISDPTTFNRKELYKNIVDMGITHISDVSGKINLSEDHIGYAAARHRDDDDISKFLSKLLNIVKYRNISRNIDKFYVEGGFSPDTSKKVSLNLTQSVSRIMVKGGYKVDDGILKCFNGINSAFEFISMNDMIYKVAIEELGIEDNSQNSLFVKGLTREEEIKYAEIILNGLVTLDGVYADKLVEWLKGNKWSEDNKFSSKREGLYNWVVYVKSNDMQDRQSELLNKLLDEGKKVVCMKSNGFYILKDEKDTEFPVGMFVVNSDTPEGEVLPDINRLEGFTGEVYSLNYLLKNGLDYVGCPILLFADSKTKWYFVDKEQTEFKESISWFKHVDASLSFSKVEFIPELFKEDSTESKLYKLICDAEEGKLIGEFYCDLKRKALDNVKKAVAKKIFK